MNQGKFESLDTTKTTHLQICCMKAESEANLIAETLVVDTSLNAEPFNQTRTSVDRQ